MANPVGRRLGPARPTQDIGAPGLVGWHGLRHQLGPDLLAHLRACVVVISASVGLTPGTIAKSV